MQVFSFDRCVSRLLEMQSDDYINSSIKFREDNIRHRGNLNNFREKEYSESKGESLHYTAEASLSLNDVSNYYDPWDQTSRMLYLKTAPLHLIENSWMEIYSASNIGKTESISNQKKDAISAYDSNVADTDIVLYLNDQLDSTNSMPDLKLSSLRHLLSSIVFSQTGKHYVILSIYSIIFFCT
jgi:hypothetical protein